jgi:succinate dehydrogenase / fumarate reductase, cytochrome b subunit
MQTSQAQGSVRRVAIARNPVTAFWQTVIGKKIVMAVTGIVLIGFVLGHVFGNLKIFLGADAINAYSRFLREVGQPELEYGQLLWIVRIVLLVCVLLHILAAYQLNRLSKSARPVGYGEKKNVKTTWSAVLMGWGGVVILAFVIFHILHLTLGKVGFNAGEFQHLQVYQNVVAAFHNIPVAIFYIVAMAALGFHLDHGIWSMLQTLGCVTRKNTKWLRALSRIIAIVVFLGFISVPISVLAGWIQ